MSEMADADIQIHLIIKGLRSSRDKRMMVCSSADRAQIVQAILAAGFGPVQEARVEAWDQGCEEATEHYAAHAYDLNSTGPVDPPTNPYRTAKPLMESEQNLS